MLFLIIIGNDLHFLMFSSFVFEENKWPFFVAQILLRNKVTRWWYIFDLTQEHDFLFLFINVFALKFELIGKGKIWGFAQTSVDFFSNKEIFSWCLVFFSCGYRPEDLQGLAFWRYLAISQQFLLQFIETGVTPLMSHICPRLWILSCCSFSHV